MPHWIIGSAMTSESQPPASPEQDAAPAAGASAATTEAAVAPAAPSTETPAQPPIPDVVPALMSGGSVLYPGIVVPYVSSEAADVEAINEASGTPSRTVGIFPQELDADGNPTGGPRAMGTVATLLRMARGPGPAGSVQAI